jgi:hypothetical protein
VAISALSFDIIKKLLPAIPHRPFQIVAVGYPDMLISLEQVTQLFGAEVAGAVKYRPDSAAIARWHGLQDSIPNIIETEHFFSLIGGQITFLDINKVRGTEIVQDLNNPLQEGLAGRFDIVYDGGTMEHCFNVGQVMQNFLALAKVGGFIYHSNPLNVGNHGFFNFNPTFYYDFYKDNGHQIVTDIMAYTGSPFNYSLSKLPETTRFHITNIPESWITLVARRMNDTPAAWPMQTKYKNNPSLSG